MSDKAQFSGSMQAICQQENGGFLRRAIFFPRSPLSASHSKRKQNAYRSWSRQNVNGNAVVFWEIRRESCNSEQKRSDIFYSCFNGENSSRREKILPPSAAEAALHDS